jgi:hypothetical protein
MTDTDDLTALLAKASTRPAPDDHAMMRGMLQVLMQTIVICRKAWPKETRRMLEKVVKS